MKISVFTTCSEPLKRQDLWQQALESYAFANEIVVVDGGPKPIDASPLYDKTVYHPWPTEFSWEFIGEQFQRGYEACSGDWVIHADLDFVFHERDFRAIHEALAQTHAPAVSFYKYQFIQPDRYNLKSRLVVAVNKGKYGDRIRFDSGGDLCQPSLDGFELTPDEVPEAKIGFYNYEKVIKNEKQIRDDIARMDRAYKKRFGKWLYSKDGKGSYEGWLKMAIGRARKPHKQIPLLEHPKSMHKTLQNLTPNQFGFDGFRNFERTPYA